MFSYYIILTFCKSKIFILKNISILIGGDICPSGLDEIALKNGDASSVFNDLLPCFMESEFVVVNIESPFVETPSLMLKSGPAHKADPKCVKGLKIANIHAVNLANNHILDHGALGLISTINSLDSAGIAFVGVGRNIQEASKLLIQEIGDLRVAFLSMAEREYSIATEHSWGANHIDIIDFCRLIKRSKGQYDRLIVLLHAGAELFPYPTPRLQKLCRFLVEEGAHAVICQHSHCAGAREIYLNAPIVYGQGNLLFNVQNMPSIWYSGYLVRLIVDLENPAFKMEMIPYFQSKDKYGVFRMNLDEEVEFFNQLNQYNNALNNSEILYNVWRDYCFSNKSMYFCCILRYGKLLRIIDRYINISENSLSVKSLLILLNLFRCDTHREALECIFEDKLQFSSYK